ncbi:MAG TPA: bifunctional DNA-binding transcriptional regulator/O6-methylguanine-DNA methyltransferase Ada [Ramlibacter sp.]|nr:bifunctional DNA-binding transcriptional regulator/O6-methylguanine-DNA methyltransferase Ada [Ramlibacter sp.]
MNMRNQKEIDAVRTASDPRWADVMARNAQADGRFFYGVRTTGVYCRPSCGSRRPRPQNVSFFDTPAQAEAAGLRPCRRCRPDRETAPGAHTELIAQICRFIEEADGEPTLDELARQAGMSAFHFHRVFKAITGVTPHEYARAHRVRKLQRDLGPAGKVTDAVYDAGYNSAGRFYAESNQILGMTPSEWREGGVNATIHFAVGECSLGSILVAKSERGVCAIWLGDDPDALVRELQDRFPRAQLHGGDAEFEALVARVVGAVEHPRTRLELPLDIRGTAFQRKVWQALQAISPGETASYTEIARRIGAPQSVRAVAQACAANPVALAIPCHRVVRSDGALSGYRWGVERKAALLKREGAATNTARVRDARRGS